MFFKCLLLLLALGSIDGTLWPDSSQCVPPRIAHGRYRLRQRSRLVRFACLPRYELVGNRYATCRNGEWDVKIPVCVRPTCRVPEIQNGLRIMAHGGAWVMFFCFPNHELIGSQAIYCDGYKWNDTAPRCVDTTISPKLSCDFEDADLCGWKQDALHDFDWLRLNSKTPSSLFFTGPSYDHTLGIGGNGHFMYIESTSQVENDTARLISPIYDSSLAHEGCFSFSYHMYGKTCGGLRVYQRPDNTTIKEILELPEEERRTYILFEKWGNLGDTWFNSVSPLTNFTVDFQIVIEGIRGSSYTSDIAIDDVAILQGENCTAASKMATTPSTPTSTVPSDSCVNRCINMYVTSPPNESHQHCSCSYACLVEENCCLDFFEVCFNGLDSTETDTNPSVTAKSVSEEAPQTLKLVAITSTEPTTTTVTSTSTKTTPTPTTLRTTTPRPTTKPTTKKPTTTPKPTTPKPTPTTKLTTTTTPKTTTRKRTTTTRPTTYRTTPKPTTFKRTTTTKPTPPVEVKRLRTTVTLTNKPITTSIYKASKPIDNAYIASIEKEKVKESIEHRGDLVEHKEGLHKEVKVIPQTKSSSVKVVMIILLLVSLTAVAMVVHAGFRSTRLRVALARFRGSRDRDPEVRYLSSDVDDD